MIVRILGYGQYDLPDEAVAELQAADTRVEAAMTAGDARAFGLALTDLVAVVQGSGRLVEPSALIASQAVVPAPGTSLAAARRLLSDDGLIPGRS